MTIDEFLERLKQTPRGWRLAVDPDDEPYGAIRLGPLGRCHCPISAVTGNLDHFASPGEVALELGLSNDDGDAIVEAADNDIHCNQVIRRRLLEACGL